MAKRKKSKKEELAEQLYVYGDKSQKEIAEYLETTEKTISIWKNDGKWDELKAAHTTGTDQIIRNLLQQNLKITEKAKEEDRIMTPQENDAIVKNAKAIKMMSKEVNLVTVIMVFKKFNNYLADLNHDLAKQLTDYEKKFIHFMNGENE